MNWTGAYLHYHSQTYPKPNITYRQEFKENVVVMKEGESCIREIGMKFIRTASKTIYRIGQTL